MRDALLPALFLPILFLMVPLASCTQTANEQTKNTAGEKPQAVMLRVAKQVQACWFKNKDAALRPYKMASELDSYSGKPRILIVPRNNPGGLPKLVAQAERRGGRTSFSVFGPLLQSNNGPRLSASLNAWAAGQKTC